MVGQAEHKIADKAAQGQEQHPLRPLAGARRNQTVRDDQQSQTGVGQRCGERGRVGQAADRPLVEELAVEMQDHSDEADGD